MPKRHDRRHSAPRQPIITSSAPAIAPERLAELLGQVTSIAAALRQAGDRAAMTDALGLFTRLPHDEQVALASALGDQRGPQATDAADVALALAELASDHAAAKEARRAGIRLRSAGAGPSIAVPRPATIASAPQAAQASAPPQFAAAWASRTRDRSEVMVAALWTAASDPKLVDPFRFTINFWEGTIDEAKRLDRMSQRQFERDELPEIATSVRNDYDGASLVSIDAGQLRALIEEALDMIAWRGTTPDPSWSDIASAVLQRVRSGEIASDPDVGLALIDPQGDADEALVNFWGSWVYGDFGLTYDLLGERHILREGVGRDEFIVRRRQWFDEAHPARFALGVIAPQTQEQSGGLWLPGAGRTSAANRQSFEMFWSMEGDETPVAGQLGEMPMATLVNQESRRRWFWQSVTVERDPARDLWRLGRIHDEALAAQALPVDDLLKQSNDDWEAANKLAEQNFDPNSEQGRREAVAVFRHINRSLSTGEVALMRLPADRTVHDEFYQREVSLRFYERAAALVQRMLARFPDQGRLLRDLCALDYQIARAYGQADDGATAIQWLERATANAEKAIAIDRTPETLTMLAEMRTSAGKDDEAEALLRESLALEGTVGAWMDLGDLLMRHQRMVEGIEAFERAQSLDANSPIIRWQLGKALEIAGRTAEAQMVYEDALAHDETDGTAHALLGELLYNRKSFNEAEPHLRRALELGAVAADHLAMLATIEMQQNHPDEANRLLQQAMQLDPTLASRLAASLPPSARAAPSRSALRPRR
jgi:tetratricopeptide (TPR) repeat protein